MAAQPWWRNSGGAGDKPVKAYTPDPNRYHAPDSTEVSRMGAGQTGAVMIPRANNDGTSRGFDASKPGVFTVDPDKNGGGVAIDPAMMSNAATQDALSRVGNIGGDDPEEQANAFAALTLIARAGAETDPDRAVVISESEENGGRRARPGQRPQPHHPSRPAAASQRQRQPRTIEETMPVDDDGGQGHVADSYDEPPMIEETPPMQVQPEPPRRPAPRQQMTKSAGQAPGESVQVSKAMLEQMLRQLNGQQAPDAAVATPPRQRQQPQRRIVRPVTVARRQQPLPPPPPPVEEEQFNDVDDYDQRFDDELDAPAVEEFEVYEESPEPVAYDDQQYQQEPEPLPPPVRRAPPQPVRRAPQYQPGRQRTQQHAASVAAARPIRPQPVRIDESILSLNVAFLQAEPAKPLVRVIFNLGQAAGTMQSRYHGVIEGAGCLVLVYDNRYEDGNQFVPPDRESPISISVPDLNKRFEALSLGMQFNMGQLDFVVLTLHNDEARNEGGTFGLPTTGGGDLEQPV